MHNERLADDALLILSMPSAGHSSVQKRSSGFNPAFGPNDGSGSTPARHASLGDAPEQHEGRSLHARPRTVAARQPPHNARGT